jgi:hypothetical protein
MIGLYDRSGVMTQPNTDLMPYIHNTCFPVALGTLSPKNTLIIHLPQPNQDATTRAMTRHVRERPGMIL